MHQPLFPPAREEKNFHARSRILLAQIQYAYGTKRNSRSLTQLKSSSPQVYAADNIPANLSSTTVSCSSVLACLLRSQIFVKILNNKARDSFLSETWYIKDISIWQSLASFCLLLSAWTSIQFMWPNKTRPITQLNLGCSQLLPSISQRQPKETPFLPIS